MNILLPPTSPGSLGDQAMVLATLNELAARGVAEVGIVEYSAHVRWVDDLPADSQAVALHPIDIDAYWQGGRDHATEEFERALRTAGRLWFIGADVLDGFYSERETLRRAHLLRLAVDAGVPVTVYSCSLNARPALGAVPALAALGNGIELFPRDPVSQARLAERLGRTLPDGADVAFLLRPLASARTDAVLGQLAAARRAGEVVVGINVNAWVDAAAADPEAAQGRGEDGRVAWLLDVYAEAMTRIAAGRPARFVLLPHDLRPPRSDEDLARQLLERLAPDLAARCLLVGAPLRADDVKHVCQGLDICVTGRMHLAIACLGSGVPPLCLSYQHKFEGLLRRFGLEHLLLELPTVDGAGALAVAADRLLTEREAVAGRIRAALPRVERLARQPFDAAAPPRRGPRDRLREALRRRRLGQA